MKQFIQKKAIEAVGDGDTVGQLQVRAMLVSFGNAIMREVEDRLKNCNHGYGYCGCSCKSALELED